MSKGFDWEQLGKFNKENRQQRAHMLGFTPLSTVLLKSVTFLIINIYLTIKNTFQVEIWPIHSCLNDLETQEKEL